MDARSRADLHIHSAVGDGLASVRSILAYVENETDLDVIAITDHDEIRGALEAREIVTSGRYRFEVIVGTEITTRQGHLLAYDVDRIYPMFRSMRDSIAAVHDAGGFVVIPHPLSWLTLSAGARTTRAVAQSDDSRTRPDGVELFNPSVAGRVAHSRARRLNATVWQISATGGSDAHNSSLIGSAGTLFPGNGAEAFRRALRGGTTEPFGRWWTVRDHFHKFAEQQWRSMVAGPSQKVARALSRPRP